MHLFVLIFVLLVMLPSVTIAQDISFTDKTYFTSERFDRIYFSEDGSFQQQLQDAFHTLPMGSILHGDWVFEDVDKTLCMTYKQFGIGRHCFQIMVEQDAMDIQVLSAIGADGKNHFVWQNMRNGNWLLTPAGLQAMKLAFDNRNIRNAIVVDNQITSYLTGKIYSGFGRTLYFANQSTGFLVFNDEITRPISWRTSSFRTMVFDQNTEQKIEDNIVTLGTEFLIPKDRKAYLYQSKDMIVVEGEDFTLDPYETSDLKEAFEPVLAQ